MSVRYKHDDIYSMYFCTFTCWNWINLFEIANAYDTVYNWFKTLKDKYNGDVVAYVIMSNHLHCILYFVPPGSSQPGNKRGVRPRCLKDALFHWFLFINLYIQNQPYGE